MAIPVRRGPLPGGGVSIRKQLRKNFLTGFAGLNPLFPGQRVEVTDKGRTSYSQGYRNDFVGIMIWSLTRVAPQILRFVEMTAQSIESRRINR